MRRVVQRDRVPHIDRPSQGVDFAQVPHESPGEHAPPSSGRYGLEDAGPGLDDRDMGLPPRHGDSATVVGAPMNPRPPQAPGFAWSGGRKGDGESGNRSPRSGARCSQARSAEGPLRQRGFAGVEGTRRNEGSPRPGAEELTKERCRRSVDIGAHPGVRTWLGRPRGSASQRPSAGQAAVAVLEPRLSQELPPWRVPVDPACTGPKFAHLGGGLPPPGYITR